MTDRDGNVVQHYPDVSGFDNEHYNEDNSAFSVSNRYTGQILDEDTGLYYYGARYGACPERSRRDPELGRFIQADPIVPGADNSQALNRYSYCFNNPLQFIDPTGHSPQEPRDLARKATVLDLFPDGALFGAGSTWATITGGGLPVNGVSIPAIITIVPGFTGAGALSDSISGSASGAGYGNNPFLVPIFNPEAAIREAKSNFPYLGNNPLNWIDPYGLCKDKGGGYKENPIPNQKPFEDQYLVDMRRAARKVLQEEIDKRGFPWYKLCTEYQEILIGNAHIIVRGNYRLKDGYEIKLGGFWKHAVVDVYDGNSLVETWDPYQRGGLWPLPNLRHDWGDWPGEINPYYPSP